MPIRERLRLVVLGIAGRTPFAGVGWQVAHYLEGFRRLGHDVVYVEDTGSWPYDPERNEITDDCRYTLGYLTHLMRRCGMTERWVYVGPDGGSFGPAAERIQALLARADVLVNLTGATLLRDEHLQVPVRVYLETDPVAPQVEVAQGRPFTIDLLAAHTHHFSYGENLHAPDCVVPVERFEYLPTRQPVVLDWWPPAPSGRADAPGRYTTVASWRQTGRDVTWNGTTYSWSKDREFAKIIDLPRRSRAAFELALACDDPAVLADLRAHGWRVEDGLEISRGLDSYRAYIRGSRGELTVAKDQNVRMRSGWFSDRSATYLAAGRPVVTQDTAFGGVLPTGAGLFAFRTIEDILAAIDAIEADYAGHRRAALDIATEHFAAERVLTSLLERCAAPVATGSPR